MSHDPTRASLIESWFDDGGDPARHDPVHAARAGLKRALPKRFYADVSVLAGEEGHVLHLDGRRARTRGGAPLAAGNAAAAALLAREWREQGADIDPASMPVTRILHAAIDHVADHREGVVADILAYAGSDLLCYRAAEPERLAELQARLWDPVLAHAQAAYGARLAITEGIGHIGQPEPALRALRAPVEARAISPARLAALHVLTTISGSALIALAIADRALEPEAGFDAGELDADFVVLVWGADKEAEARRAARRADFLAAAALLHALEG